MSELRLTPRAFDWYVLGSTSGPRSSDLGRVRSGPQRMRVSVAQDDNTMLILPTKQTNWHRDLAVARHLIVLLYWSLVTLQSSWLTRIGEQSKRARYMTDELFIANRNLPTALSSCLVPDPPSLSATLDRSKASRQANKHDRLPSLLRSHMWHNDWSHDCPKLPDHSFSI